MHFTLWPSLTQSEGGHGEIDWPSFVDFVRNPVISAERETLEGWSPAKFKGNRRKASACEAVSAIVLDDDKSGLPIERVCELWGDVSGVVHSSHSHTSAAPRWRIILRTSRDMTPSEHTRVWAAVRDVAASSGQTIDEATKDPSRLWFVPACKPGAEYECRSLVGEPLDVDAILADYRPSDTNIAPAILAAPHAAPGDRRHAMAVALGAAWPAKGRHEAQLALAGALRAEGWTAEDAVEFLCTVTRTAGNEDRAKREATVRHTWGKPAGAALTGWTRLKSFVDPVVVDATRGAIGRDADFKEKTERRLAELETSPAGNEPGDAPDEPAGLGFEFGIWDKEPPPIEFLVDELIPRGCVGMFFGRADALKTWLLFSLGLAVASGRPWLGHFNVRKSAKVGIVDFETGKANVDRRLFMLGAGTVQNLGRKSFAKLKPNDPEFWFALAAEKFDLVIIDSLRRSNPGANENESGEAIVPLELAAEFSEITKAAVLFIHHAKKDTADGWPEFRGSGAIEDQVDVSFAVKKTDMTAELKTVEIKCIKPGDMRTPAPFVVEVSFDDKARQAMLRRIESAPQPKDDTKPKDNRELALQILNRHPTGIRREDLINMLEGSKDDRRRVISELFASSVVVEIREGRKVLLMINPNH